MIEDIENGDFIVTEGTTSLRNMKIETSVTLRNLNTTKRCCQLEINQDNCMELTKHAISITLQILQ